MSKWSIYYLYPVSTPILPSVMYDKHADKNDGIPPNKTAIQASSKYHGDAHLIILTSATSRWLITNPVNRI